MILAWASPFKQTGNKLSKLALAPSTVAAYHRGIKTYAQFSTNIFKDDCFFTISLEKCLFLSAFYPLRQFKGPLTVYLTYKK